MDAEDDFLQMSGLQHFAFCKRQWALIHLEQQWAENVRTVEGDLLHERAHDDGFSQKRGNILTVRGLRVQSPTLYVSGICDVVEFFQDPHGVPLQGRDGLWLPCPVEYKRGKPKEDDMDRLQLCCQAMCLEEMLGCEIERGALFYGEIRRREQVELTKEMRSKVCAMLKEMREYQQRGYTPKVKTGQHCRACSLQELCLPVLCKNPSASAYLKKALETEDS